MQPLSQFVHDPQHLWLLLLGVACTLALFIGLFMRRVYRLWQPIQRSDGGAKLQKKVVWTFTLVTMLPTVAVSLFSTVFFNLGVEAWFNQRVNTAVEESLFVAEAYLNEHRENIRVDALALSTDISRFADLSFTNSIEFNRLVSAQASQRRLTEVVVFHGNRIIAQGRLSFSLAFENLPMNALERAESGEVVILQSADPEDADKVRALTKVPDMKDTFVLVGRLVDDRVISHMAKTQGAVNEYRELLSQLTRLQWAFSVVFISLAILLLLAAAWYGLIFATRLTKPIARLADAAERVRAGDYEGRVEPGAEDDEISRLTRTFNRMVEQLDAQRRELIEANRELDDRRRFSEAVLGGVSAGVMAVDKEKRITLCNRSAAAMLAPGDDPAALKGRHINELLPGIQESLIQAEAGATDAPTSSISIPRGQSTITLHVRVTVERSAEGIDGFIVTCDDITPLVAAQRTAAWSDVARRVAHEIKNPLTPIALSAERLKRKYLKYMEGEEAETFSKYLDTITRHVGDIGRMVEEFVGFARMPTAIMQQADLLQIVRKVLFSEQVAHPTIRYELHCEQSALPFICDERQVAQAISNILKNAAEAVESKLVSDGVGEGKINLSLGQEAERLTLVIEDNGPGFPQERIDQLMDPYVTTRAKGMGLGLAIVKKIVEEHKGNMQLSVNPAGGARVTLSFLQQCDINVAA